MRMNPRTFAAAFAVLVFLTPMLILFTPTAHAVPSYSRTYGVECSTCHTMWGSLNGGGVTFRLSGYRAVNGRDLPPVTDLVEISKNLTIPPNLPLSIITGVGLDSRTEKRELLKGGTSATGETSVTTEGTSLALEDLSIFLTGPINKHLSAFIEFPMYETKAWEFTPTGNFEAHNANRPPDGPGRQLAFTAEKPVFEVAKFWWNNLLGDSVQRDSVNLLAGITHLPIGYASGKVRLSVNQYLIYERTALSLISPKRVDDVVGGDPNDFLFRLGEPQVMAEINGMLTFGKPVTDVAKRETFWAEYHLGMTNGTNANPANPGGAAVYGRGVVRWYNQSFGMFAYSAPDSYSDALRTNASIGGNSHAGTAQSTGIMSGKQTSNPATRLGMDATLSLAPFGIPMSLENQYMWNSESNPTGFGERFEWEGGFHQFNWQISKTSITYVRYDYVMGSFFDDTNRTVAGFGKQQVTGITLSHPKEQDYVVGFQHLIEQNVKLIVEYRDHVFDDAATGPTQSPARLSDQGGTFRVMFGF